MPHKDKNQETLRSPLIYFRKVFFAEFLAQFPTVVEVVDGCQNKIFFPAVLTLSRLLQTTMFYERQFWSVFSVMQKW